MRAALVFAIEEYAVEFAVHVVNFAVFAVFAALAALPRASIRTREGLRHAIVKLFRLTRLLLLSRLVSDGLVAATAEFALEGGLFDLV